jgi:hypothetical protein
MDATEFPEGAGPELAGLTFIQVFEQKPKVVEFLRKLWIERCCTGIFLDFFKFVKGMLNCPFVMTEHEERCKEYVKTIENDKVPTYMKDYL